MTAGTASMRPEPRDHVLPALGADGLLSRTATQLGEVCNHRLDRAFFTARAEPIVDHLAQRDFLCRGKACDDCRNTWILVLVFNDQRPVVDVVATQTAFSAGQESGNGTCNARPG